MPRKVWKGPDGPQKPSHFNTPRPRGPEWEAYIRGEPPIVQRRGAAAGKAAFDRSDFGSALVDMGGAEREARRRVRLARETVDKECALEIGIDPRTE